MTKTTSQTTNHTPTAEPPQPDRVDLLPVEVPPQPGGYRDDAKAGPDPLLIRRRAQPPKGFVAFCVVILATQLLGAGLAQTTGTRLTLAMMAVASLGLLGYAIYYGVLNATLIQIDDETVSRRDKAKGMHDFEAATRDVDEVFAAQHEANPEAHLVNVRLSSGDVERLLACDGEAEAAYVAFKLQQWLAAHRGESG